MIHREAVEKMSDPFYFLPANFNKITIGIITIRNGDKNGSATARRMTPTKPRIAAIKIPTPKKTTMIINAANNIPPSPPKIPRVAPAATPKSGSEIIEQPRATSKIPMERRTRDLKDIVEILSFDFGNKNKSQRRGLTYWVTFRACQSCRIGDMTVRAKRRHRRSLERCFFRPACVLLQAVNRPSTLVIILRRRLQILVLKSVMFIMHGKISTMLL
jgi:hypothetical protein